MKEFILLSSYKYLALLFFAVVEGPILSLLSGFFIRLGYLNFLPVFLILLLGDIISDTIYYFGAVKTNGVKYIKKYGKKFKSISEDFEMLKDLWKRHGRVTMFLGKFAYGFTAPLVISAALSGVSYRKIMEYILPPTAVKYALLIAVGYYMADSYKTAERFIYLSAVYVPVIIIAFILGYKLVLRYLKNKAGSGKK